MQLQKKIIGFSILSCSLGLVVFLGFYSFLNTYYSTNTEPDTANNLRSFVFATGLAIIFCWWCIGRLTRNLSHSIEALEMGLLNFKDKDYSVTLPLIGDTQLRTLAQLFNESASELRRERQHIYQRELLLEKVIQSSPNIMLLLDRQQRIIYSNTSARHFFNKGSKIEGLSLADILNESCEELIEAFEGKNDTIFSMGEKEIETWHLSRGHFTLNNQQHNLVLLKQMTREINRQEVAVWKKVIRIVSHELNNSLAPISSMVNSGRLLTKQLEDKKLELIFDTIEDRTKHLSEFISNYARFAKLPTPKLCDINWQKLTDQLAQHHSFTLTKALPPTPGRFDLAQLEQVLINLLKNAHESGSATNDIDLHIEEASRDNLPGFILRINDRGCGMSPSVLDQALLPFYSTKQAGTGLGLPLCREIVEAHNGLIRLQNRKNGGLCVNIWLPLNPQVQ